MKLKFYAFHLMPYPYIDTSPSEETGEYSTWVTIPNKNMDPIVAHQLYNEYLDQLVSAEKYGFDGIIVNEHHSNAYGTMPSPNIMASHIIARTKNIPVGVVGNALPLHGNPVRVAEEIALLDCISGGRIISGFVRGIGCEYFNHPVKPSDSIGRMWEAVDLILKAWTEREPFTWQGDHWYIPNVNIWPRPVQHPHPPIWMPGQGSLETIRNCAKYKFTFMQIYSPQWFTKKSVQMLREEANKCGYDAPRDQFIAAVPTYVAETDEQAHREAKAHMQWLFNTGLNIPDQIYFPKGYMSKASWSGLVGSMVKYGIKEPKDLTYSDLLKDRYVIVGSPSTVREQIEEYCDDVGAGGLIGAGTPFGPMPSWMSMKNMQIFSEEVMPYFRDADGMPEYMKQDRPAFSTNAQRGTRMSNPERPPLSHVEGLEHPVDHRSSHLPEVIDPSWLKAAE
ncbi:MAG: LLM class flavin-dependent oxidoreductase [Rhodospirillales bacterium]|nr:LLM class flavin-dependent oxidoreductase [Rhodospirillales bacterium]